MAIELTAEIISSILFSIAIFISALKKNAIIAIAIIVMALGFLTLLQVL